jgi:hypothetical protein
MSRDPVSWKKQPVEKDFAAATSFLSLIYPTARTQSLVRALRNARTVHHIAKDLLRASNLPLLSPDEPHVAQDLKRIRKGKPLSPVLLVRGDMSKAVPLIVADGYHRICAVCYYDEDAPISCVLVQGQG